MGGSGRWRDSFAVRRLVRAEGILGNDIVKRTADEAVHEFRRSIPMTLREWDIATHGTRDEQHELMDELQDTKFKTKYL